MHKRLVALCVVAVLGSLAPVQTASAATFSISAAMQSAAQTRSVPLALIQAIAYVNTRWEVINQPALDHGFLPMDISPAQLTDATALSGHTTAQVESDPAANIDASAALLAHSHGSGTDLASWQPAVAAVLGPYVAVEVFQTLRSGASRTTSAGESIVLAPQFLPADTALAGKAAATTPTSSSSDYPPASWVPASPDNYTVANRPHDYPVDMIIIHDTEGSYGSAIQEFQNGATQASAHYVVSAAGQITQMVAEKDIAWHAGNWDYNTRAIGIEHEGFACCYYYTDTQYQASAHLAASICQRWGVPMDRTHVIGHYQVPDPNNPGQFGGAGHHTDPGATWDWTRYMGYAQAYAAALPSPPHMAVDPVVVSSGSNATVTWGPARSCHAPITGYTVVSQPGNLVQDLPSNATSATFTGLQAGTTYTFVVTAHNSFGNDSLSVTAGPQTANEALTGPIASGPAVASWSSNRQDVFFRGVNGQLYHQTSVGSGWSAPESLGGGLTSAPAAVSWGSNRIDVFARGADNGLWHKAWYGTAWSEWESLGGGLSSAPVVASWSGNRLDVFARGFDMGLWHKAWYGAWSAWESLGGGLTSAPAAVSWGPNRIDVLVRGIDQRMYHKVWDGSPWSGWEVFSGSISSAPTVSSWASDRLDVFALTATGTLQHKAWDGIAWSSWVDIGGDQFQADPASRARKVGTIDVFAEGIQSTLWHVTVTTA
jgi:N-acetylmuramoyl-L-alanine amidase/Fibronectin type III domain